MESILTSIKKLLGVDETDTSFDTDIIIGINTAISALTQIGVGPKEGFSIKDSSTTWDEFIPDTKRLENVKSYIHLKTKLLFDPPTSSAVIKVIEDNIKELEWRINVAVDPGEEAVENG